MWTGAVASYPGYLVREWRDLVGYLRFVRGLPAFLQRTISPEEARSRIQAAVRNRQARFLRMLELSVYGNDRSPYLRLMRHAGCELEDVRRSVRSDGLEGALGSLRRAGVYIGWDEFKGRDDCRRGSFRSRFEEHDFDNPVVRGHYEVSSGGSSGRPTRMRIDLDNLEESCVNWAVWFAANGWLGRPLIFWTPTHTGMANRYLRCAKFGMRYTSWYATTTMTASRDRLRAALVHEAARFAGGFEASLPGPIDDPARIGEPLLALSASGKAPVVNTAPSSAALLSEWALSRGASLEGVDFILGAEPVTAERRRAIEASGAKAFATYGTSEGGWIAAAFPGSAGVDEVQLFMDAYAVAPLSDQAETNPLLFTSLRQANPKVLLNADIGDAGRITGHQSETAAALGYRFSLSEIRSYRKITAWGVTLAVADLYPILERALPERLGGGPTDYQLVEELEAGRSARLVLRIRPGATSAPDGEIRRAFLDEISRKASYYQFMLRVLEQADSLQLARQSPLATAGGKYLAVLPAARPAVDTVDHARSA